MYYRVLLLSLLFSFSPSAFGQQYINLLTEDMRHWMKPNGDPVTEGWTLEADGVLHLAGKGGNIITRQQYGDFELWFEFRISEKGNSGIKYRVKQYNKNLLGLEYQVLDDVAYPQLTRDHLTASLYDLVEPIPTETRLVAAPQFNVGKIRVQGGRTQHWVNGQLTIDQSLQGPDWQTYVSKSKFKDHEAFGENVLGHLMLTDHNSEVWFKNVFIRQLDSVPCQTLCSPDLSAN